MSEILRGSFAILLFIFALLIYCFLPDSGAEVGPGTDLASGAMDHKPDLSARKPDRSAVESDVSFSNGKSRARRLLAHVGSEDAASGTDSASRPAMGGSASRDGVAAKGNATDRSTSTSRQRKEDSFDGGEQVDESNKPARGGILWWLLKLGLFLALLAWLLRWIFQWLTSGTTAAASGLADYESGRDDAELGQVYVRPPARVDDLTQIDGIDTAAAKRLNAAGIYQLDQLKSMSTSQREAVQRKFNLPSLGWGAAGSAVSEVGTAAVASPGAKSSVKPESLSGAGGGGLIQPGFSARAAAKLEKSKGPSAAGQHQGLATPAMKMDADFGQVYTTPPVDRDDLSKLEGVDKHMAARLNAAGIYKFDQLKNLTGEQQSALQRRFELPTIDVGKWNLAIPGLAAAAVTIGGVAAAASTGAKSAVSATATAAGKVVSATASNSITLPKPSLPTGGIDAGSTNAGSTNAGSTRVKDSSESGQKNSGRAPVLPGAMDHFNADAPEESTEEDAEEIFCGASTRIDLDFGEVFIHPPQDKNDLTELTGVDESVASKMNAAGIYKFSQLQSLSPRQQASFKRRFGISYGDWESKIQSLDAGKSTAGENSRQNSGEKGISPGFRSTETTASSGKRPIGFAPRAPVSEDKIAPATEFADEHERSRQVDSPGPLTKDTARIDRELGFLYTSAPDRCDDLTRLAGVDAAMAAKLNRAGIYKFDQIKSLSEQQQSALAKRFDLGDVDFDDWQRCVYAWGRGIDTTADQDRDYPKGKLHGIELPEITKGVFDGDQLVAYPEQVIFRGEDPAAWGQNVDAIRSDINYLRLRRADTRESVVVPMTKAQIFANGDPAENGWNGSAETFFGGRHVGVFGKGIPQEVETKCSQGGWGFGHRYDHNDRQEWGWEGRVIEPTTFEVSVGRIGEVPGTVVFRSADPGLWNTRTREGESRMSDPISSVRHPINFVRIMREATGEAVIVPTTGGVLDEDNNPRCGWNGSNTVFTGGHHLGAYHVDLPQEAETKFGVGGWGFGHPYNDNDRQSWAWAGRQLPATVFEISVLESVPEFMAHELVS